MLLSERNMVHCGNNLRDWSRQCLARTLLLRSGTGYHAAQFTNQQHTAAPAQGPHCGFAPPAPKQHAEPPLAALPLRQEHTKIAMVPLAWRRSLPPDTTLIGNVYVDTLHLQLGVSPPNIPPRPS